ncbi:hypothetical protein AMTRI_Chr09g39170 [Amborella trichopoda]
MLRRWLSLRFKSNGFFNILTSLFFTTIWFLWAEHNQRVFQDRLTRREQLVRQIISHVRELADAKSWTFHLSEKEIIDNLQFKWYQQRDKITISVTWSFPSPNHFKKNINGASLHSPGQARGCCFIRNSDGAFIAAFTKPFRIASNNYAEFYDLEEGLILADQLPYSD